MAQVWNMPLRQLIPFAKHHRLVTGSIVPILLLRASEQPDTVLSRFIGIQANASSFDQSDLDGAATLRLDDILDWGRQMIELNMKYGVKILGGCCGTGTRHLQFIVDNITV